MINNRRTGYARQLNKLQLIGGCVFAIVLGVVLTLVWQLGTQLFLGIPMQIGLISLLLPIVLGVLVYWFAHMHDKLSWQRDDER